MDVTITPEPGYEIDDTRYTFVMPAGNVTIQATFVIEVPTGVADINAVAGEPMRYFDLQGRYIGTSLDGARRGIYVTADGRRPQGHQVSHASEGLA